MKKVYVTRQKTILRICQFTEKGKSKIEGTYIYINIHMYVPVCHTGFAARGCGGMPPGKKIIFTSQKLVLNIMMYNIMDRLTGVSTRTLSI